MFWFLVISIESLLLLSLGFRVSLWDYFLKCVNKVYYFQMTNFTEGFTRLQSEAVTSLTWFQQSLFLQLWIEFQHWWRFYTFMMINIGTKVLGLQRNIFGFLIYYIFNRNAGKALSAVIWFKFHSTFCIWPNSLISYFLVFCCASLLAVDILICGFIIKF